MLFISYARVDAEDFAKKLHDDLEKAGLSVWLDQRDIPIASDWDKAIDEALETCTGVIVLMTQGSVLSHQVKSEWNDALNRYLPIVPLLVLNCHVPRALNVLNYLDFRTNYASMLPKLIERIRSLDTDHAQHLHRLLGAFKEAQDEATPDAKPRFQSRIDDLTSALKNFEIMVEAEGQSPSTRALHPQQPAPTQTAALSPTTPRIKIIGTHPHEQTTYFVGRMAEKRLLSQFT